MPKRALAKMLFWTFLIIFVTTAAVTLLGLVGVLKIAPGYLQVLFAALILEVVGGIVSLFRVTLGLSTMRVALDFGEMLPPVAPATCKCTIRPSQPGQEPRTVNVNVVREPGALVVTLPNVGPGESVQLESSEDGRAWRSDPFSPFITHAEMHLCN